MARRLETIECGGPELRKNGRAGVSQRVASARILRVRLQHTTPDTLAGTSAARCRPARRCLGTLGMFAAPSLSTPSLPSPSAGHSLATAVRLLPLLPLSRCSSAALPLPAARRSHDPTLANTAQRRLSHVDRGFPCPAGCRRRRRVPAAAGGRCGRLHRYHALRLLRPGLDRAVPRVRVLPPIHVRPLE